MQLTDAAFYLAGGLTIAYMTKLFVVLFVEHSDPVPENGQQHERTYISRPSAIALAASAALLPLLGCFTAIMEKIADWGQAFFRGYTPDYAVPYFTWANLASSGISLTIGMAVYFLIVRGFLKRRDWPAWLDLENLVYRPALGSLIRCTGLIAYAAASLPDTLTLRLESLGQRLSKFWERPALIGRFSLELLLVGAGVCATLVYVFVQALGV
jgi:hydrogenase-4 component B